MLTIIEWKELMDRISHLKIRTFEDSYADTNVVNIRHDVDNNIFRSVEMAFYEKKMGIKSTYFILDTSPYWNLPGLGGMLKSIVDKGHRLGWHNNAITNHFTTQKPLERCIEEPLRYLRQFDDVIGTAGHGDPLCHRKHYLNYYIWNHTEVNKKYPTLPNQRFFLSKFRLKYEAYYVRGTHYLSDAGGKWNTDPEGVISHFEEYGGKLIINIHPQWWEI